MNLRCFLTEENHDIGHLCDLVRHPISTLKSINLEISGIDLEVVKALMQGAELKSTSFSGAKELKGPLYIQFSAVIAESRAIPKLRENISSLLPRQYEFDEWTIELLAERVKERIATQSTMIFNTRLMV